MKLNLLPTTVSKGRQAQGAIFFSVLIAVAGLVIGGFLNVTSTKALEQARSDQQASMGPAQDAYNESTKADTIMGAATTVAMAKDARLAQEMVKHNDVYPELYNSVLPYIPSFYRINSLSATPAGASAVVTLVGTLDTYQQYANLMLAFSRYPGLVTITRSGFQGQDEFVPNIDSVDAIGKPRKPNDGPIPDDKLDRLAYFQAQASTQQEGYTGIGNFGTGTDSTRNAMPTASLVTVTLTIPKDLQVPEPRQTLSSGGAAPAAGGMMGGPGGMGGPPAGIPIPGAGAGAPGAAGASAAAGGGASPRGKGGKDADE